MPREDFYAGLTLAQQLQKLADHHSDPKVRHISQYENAILDRAVALLEEPLTTPQAIEEFDDAWHLLSQVYSTIVLDSERDRRLLVLSVPTRPDRSPPAPGDLIGDLTTVGVGSASPRSAQIALNLLIHYQRDPATDLEAVWSTLNARRSPPTDPVVDADDHEFLNRVLYQPTVAIEHSPPVFASVASVLAEADPTTAWISTVLDEAGDPVVVATSLGAILVFRLLRGPVDGISSALRERLYEWIRPSRDE